LLPYVFDLLFDIKTRRQLAHEYVDLEKRLEDMRKLMLYYAIVFTKDELAAAKESV